MKTNWALPGGRDSSGRNWQGLIWFSSPNYEFIVRVYFFACMHISKCQHASKFSVLNLLFMHGVITYILWPLKAIKFSLVPSVSNVSVFPQNGILHLKKNIGLGSSGHELAGNSVV